ncbi:ABC transporter substrate-binding protein [Legionella sp. CNM-4043-24]|uniref:ABC transporter substrate-binding protein n=1 Tax=Legionella sp. CNM-4043-24 TaxID=3421646 RepID=UPI00403B126B
MSHAAMALLLNNPYPDDESDKPIYYSSFAEQPKTLDPARSYSSNEYQFIAQIYEPPLNYDYYLRPYQLMPATAESMPELRFLDRQGNTVPAGSPDIVQTVYTIKIKPGILYQPHPALAKDDEGQYRYLNLSEDYLDDNDISQLSDFPFVGTREVTADDYIYQIKRLASPAVSSPIYGLMSDHIVGFADFAKGLPASKEGDYLDLRLYNMAGVRKLDDYRFEISVIGQYRQFENWLAMPFFSPIPWEADKFYSQPGMDDKNLSFDWYPIGTGPFMLSENNPNRHMVLDKNPHFRVEYFPDSTNPVDKKNGYTQHAGQRLPLISRAVYVLEKESIPRWNKFLQGYYDMSGIATDSYDQAIQLDAAGKPMLSDAMLAKGMRLSETIDPSIYFMGFNMLDPVVGGKSERARKLRQAISIAVNYDENISIFFNGRGKAAQGPIPPGIIGYKDGEAGINPYVYTWNGQRPVRRSLDDARRLLTAAGYPDGRDPATGRALMLHYDVPLGGSPDDKAQLDWMRKQFASIGIDLDIRGTEYNRFQDKMRNGNAQLFSWGWNADYPDPENFLFLLYGLNGKVAHGGENASNYQNRQYDRLFEQMRNAPDGPARQQLIDQMVEIARHDAPLVWGINTQSLFLSQQWLSVTKPNTISMNQLKYMAIDFEKRANLREAWNRPVFWPLALIFGLILLCLWPLRLIYRRKEKQSALRANL